MMFTKRWFYMSLLHLSQSSLTVLNESLLPTDHRSAYREPLFLHVSAFLASFRRQSSLGPVHRCKIRGPKGTLTNQRASQVMMAAHKTTLSHKSQRCTKPLAGTLQKTGASGLILRCATMLRCLVDFTTWPANVPPPVA